MKKVLFVAYGSGHINMLIPVAQALQSSGRARAVVLALTTAAPVAQAAGLDVYQFKDFVLPGDEAALAVGRQLVQGLHTPMLDEDESAAYLGLSYADLVDSVGAAAAQADYALRGRQAFLPVRTLGRVIDRLRPDVVVATNSPRAERAAVVAARHSGIPAICVVDLFAIDEVQWIGAPDYADRVCVLNAVVRDFLVAAGRLPEQVVVTGNPSFDALNTPQMIEAGRALKAAQGWEDKTVILWPTQVEPACHPFNGRPGKPALPGRILQILTQWAAGRSDVVLCIRSRAGEPAPLVPLHPRIVCTGQDWPLPALLHASDWVVTLTSTVGLQGYLAGCQVLQLTGSVFDDAMPLARFGMTDAVATEQTLASVLERCTTAARRPAQTLVPATAAVLSQINAFL